MVDRFNSHEWNCRRELPDPTRNKNNIDCFNSRESNRPSARLARSITQLDCLLRFTGMTMCMTVSGNAAVFGREKGWLSKSVEKSGAPVVIKSLGRVRAAASSAANRTRRDENVEGEFYVDLACINCDTCRWMTPTVFVQKNHQSAVYHQPTSQEERFKALQALLACPTSSIHTVNPPKDIVQVQKSFPLPVDADLPGIYHCGYHSDKAFGATTYFITGPEGNVLIDSPRYSEPLAKRLEDLGGVRYLFLTHRDDVADHKKWQSRFNLERILHEDEVTVVNMNQLKESVLYLHVPRLINFDEVTLDTEDVETKLKGEGNWTLGPNIDLIFTPGHTEGHVCLLLKEEGVLFTGDHFWASPDGDLMLGLYNKHSMSLQIDSLEALISYDFTWVLPGHGRRKQFRSVQAKNDAVIEVVSRERTELPEAVNN